MLCSTDIKSQEIFVFWDIYLRILGFIMPSETMDYKSFSSSLYSSEDICSSNEVSSRFILYIYSILTMVLGVFWKFKQCWRFQSYLFLFSLSLGRAYGNFNNLSNQSLLEELGLVMFECSCFVFFKPERLLHDKVC